MLCAPINPRRDGSRAAMRFRARGRGGTARHPGWSRRCFTRCDEAGFVGEVEVLRALSDTRLVATQGPTWLVSGTNF